MTDNKRFHRRAFLATTGVSLAAVTAGCFSSQSDNSPDTGPDTDAETNTTSGDSTDDEDSEARELPSVAAPDESIVYIPSHVDGTHMVGMENTGPYMVSLMYTLVHDFWVFAGDDKSYVTVEPGQNMHIMSTVWEPEYGHLLPTGNPSMTIRGADGDIIDERALWSMLAQQMGVHFGDNIQLPERGEYTVQIDIDPVSTRQLGGYVNEFNTAESVTFDLEFSFEDLNGIRTELLNDSGRPGALPPMQMDMRPNGALPEPSELPGEHAGTQTTADVEFVVQVIETAPDGIDSDNPYLIVSPRTPYNAYPLPFMGLRAQLDNEDSTVLPAGLHPEIGYHYGAVIPEFADSDSLEIEIGSSPQISRHRGYQTTFLDFDTLEYSL